MWSKLGNSSIFKWTVIKINFLEGCFFGYGFQILHQRWKRVKTKSQKVLGANSYVCRSYKGKTGRGPFYPPSWMELRCTDSSQMFQKTRHVFLSQN